jgi:hypothetical protein
VVCAVMCCQSNTVVNCNVVGNLSEREGAKVDHGLYTNSSTTLVVSGDAVVGRALTLLLRGSRYDTKFVPTSSLSEAGVLEDVQLLMLVPTPELDTDHREALLGSLRDVAGAGKIQILELVPLSGEDQEGETWDKAWHMVLWPCEIEELERRIEMILHGAPATDVGRGLRRG